MKGEAMRDPDFTLSAGPTMAPHRVLAALGKPITYHYDPAFIEAFRRTERKVAEIFLTKCDVLLMQGEAVLGLEAAARSLVHPGMPVLNLVSGVFGKGMGYWLKDFGADLHELEVAYNDSVEPADVERYLDDHPEIELVTVVHSETPSGTQHDLAAIGPIAKAHDALALVDCVSSLGGIEFRTDDWQLDVCVAGAQKCLGGPPGVSLMTVSEAAWAKIAANPAAPRASFLSMLDWKEQWIEGEKFPFTPSVSDMHGIEGACDELLEEGLDESIARHDLSARSCRAGVKAMGLDLWPRSEEITAACVTAITVPNGLTDREVRDHCRERYGVMISGGQGAGNLVRIGHMGPTARSLYPVVGLAAAGQTLVDLGVQVDIGAGVEAALAELSQVKHAERDKPGVYPFP
jgi:pyridoxamine---pyruvate transaminase